MSRRVIGGITVPDNIMNIVAYFPISKKTRSFEFSKRIRSITQVIFSIMVTRLDFVAFFNTIIKGYITYQVPYQFSFSVPNQCVNLDITIDERILNIQYSGIRIKPADKAAHNQGVTGISPRCRNISFDTYAIHHRNFFTDTANATNLCKLLTSCSRRRWNRLVGNQVRIIGRKIANNDIPKIQRLSPFRLRKPANNATYKDIAQTIFNANGTRIK